MFALLLIVPQVSPKYQRPYCTRVVIFHEDTRRIQIRHKRKFSRFSCLGNGLFLLKIKLGVFIPEFQLCRTKKRDMENLQTREGAKF